MSRKFMPKSYEQIIFKNFQINRLPMRFFIWMILLIF